MGMAELRKAAPIASLSMDCGLSGMVVVWCIVRCASIHAGPPYGTCVANAALPRPWARRTLYAWDNADIVKRGAGHGRRSRFGESTSVEGGKALSGRILAQSESGATQTSSGLLRALRICWRLRGRAAGATRWELDALLGDGVLLVEPDPSTSSGNRHGVTMGTRRNSATAAWLSKLATPSDAFLRKCDECGVYVSVDDLGDPRVSREVSAWISEKTRGLLSPAISLSSVALACLVSALYLKDAWADPFEEYLTNRALFHAEDGGVRVAFMHDERCCRVIDGDDCVAFGMPLSSDAEMLFALPNSGGDHMGEALELFERLSCGEGERELVELGIPRFECETTIPDLGMQLEAAGVYSASAMNLVPMVGVGSHSDAGHPWGEAVYRREGSGGWRLYDYDCMCGMPSGESARTAQDNAQQAFLRRGRISHRCFALRGACRFAIGCSAAGRRSFPAASPLSTPRSLATRSTGAFSCRRSRCLGRRLLPPLVALAGRGSWARGVPRG